LHIFNIKPQWKRTLGCLQETVVTSRNKQTTNKIVQNSNRKKYFRIDIPLFKVLIGAPTLDQKYLLTICFLLHFNINKKARKNLIKKYFPKSW
jgi:hypothetical protein